MTATDTTGPELAVAQLEAGALLPTDSPVPADRPIDDVQAHAFRHPALGPDPVVRLVPDNQAPGVDVEMEILGFDPGTPSGVVGRSRREALGFPGWALINAPDRAHFALEVVKDFKHHMKKAKSKPGQAKDGINTIGEQLGRTAPDFLPSFYEQAGREFVVADSTHYGAIFFSKAREAERVHALEIDTEHRRQTFLEFALAGALSTKELSAYATELSYPEFRDLCLKRTLGGMPPWPAMATELRKLQKAAGLDRATEDRQLLLDLLPAPALSQANPAFWKAYRTPLIALARESAETRNRLLELFPTVPYGKPEFEGEWLQFLDDAGAIDDLANSNPATSSPGSSKPMQAAAWFGRLLDNRRPWMSRPVEVFQTLRRVAPRLVADGEPVVLASRMIPVDLVDLALELGVPLTAPAEVNMDLRRWARQVDDHAETGRDLAHVAAHPRFGPLLADGFAQAAPDADFRARSIGVAAFDQPREAWLSGLVSRGTNCSIPTLTWLLDTIADSTSQAEFIAVPDAHRHLVAIDPVDTLARTLRAGGPFELGWPALEEAATELGGDLAKLTVVGCYPYAIVYNSIKAIAVGPNGRAGEHELRLPAKAELVTLRYCQDQFMVCYTEPGSHDLTGYWTGRPAATFAIAGPRWNLTRVTGRGVQLPDGSITEGGRAYAAGDTDLVLGGDVSSDGTSYWRFDNTNYDEPTFREFDPRTGDKGRASLPPWIADFAEDGMVIDRSASYLLPIADGAPPSPLGSRDGMIGWRVRRTEQIDGQPRPDRLDAESIDGRSTTLDPIASSRAAMRSNGTVIGLLDLPGRTKPLRVRSSRYYEGLDADLVDDETGEVVALRNSIQHLPGWIQQLPIVFWHLFEPRDASGSKLLRAMDHDQARALLDAGRRDISDDAAKGRHLAAALAETLPTLADPGLIRGVTELVNRAASDGARLERLVVNRDPDSDVAAPIPEIEIGDLQKALPLAANYRFGSRGDLAAPLVAIAAAFERGTRTEGEVLELPELESALWPWLDVTETAAYLVTSPFLDDEARRDLLSLLRLVATTGILDLRDRLRFHTVTLPEQDQSAACRLVNRDGNDYVIPPHSNSWYWQDDLVEVIEFAPDGGFTPPRGADVEQINDLTGRTWGTAEVARFLTLFDERGPIPFDVAHPRAIAEQSVLTYPEVALIWSGFPNFRVWAANFLPREVRTTLGLKVAEAKVGRDSLRALGQRLLSLVAATVPEDPGQLWQLDGDDGRPGRLARAIATAFAGRTAVPAAVIEETARRRLPLARSGTFLSAYAAPEQAEIFSQPMLTLDELAAADDDPPVDYRRDPTGFDTVVAHAVVAHTSLLFSHLPVGDPLRAAIPAALGHARDRLLDESAVIRIATDYIYDAGSEVLKDFWDRAGRLPPADDDPLLVLVVDGYNVTAYVRPAIAQAEGRWDEVLHLADQFPVWPAVPMEVLPNLAGDHLAEFAKRVRDTPVPDGGYEANPQLSVPDLVTTVADERSLSADAAGLYLQLLAVAEPTTANIRTWNGWKPARLNKALAELTAQDLVVEAKRKRAGRKHFVPGPWLDLKAPQLPVEAWKESLYDIEVLGMLPPEPFHLLFGTAWERVTAGDQPRYDEIS